MKKINALMFKSAVPLKLAIMMGLFALQTPAYAVTINQMQATAFQNTVVTDDHVSAVSESTPVIADIGDARASAKITQLDVAARSFDVQTRHVDGIAVQYSLFTFWNTATDSAYSATALAGIDLTMDFKLEGWAIMPGLGNASSTSYTYNTELFVGAGYDHNAGGASIACGPVNCSGSGSPSLNIGLNEILSTFSLTRSITANNGLFYTYLATLDGGGTSSALTLSLTGLRQSGATSLPLGLKFADGTILDVRPVPVPGAAGLMLAGLSLLGLRSRRLKASANT